MKYSLMWVSPIRKYICGGHNDLDVCIETVEYWYQTVPRGYNKPKIVCNITGRVVYE